MDRHDKISYQAIFSYDKHNVFATKMFLYIQLASVEEGKGCLYSVKIEATVQSWSVSLQNMAGR